MWCSGGLNGHGINRFKGYHMKRSIVINIILAILFMAFIVWKFTSSNEEADELYKKLIKEYPVLKIKDNIESSIIDIYVYPFGYTKNPYSKKVSLSENAKYTIYTKKYINDGEIKFGNILRKGSKLRKRANSDTLLVINEQEKYYFLIKETF